MAFRDLLRENKEAVVQKWLDKALATYSGDSSAVFKREKDPFANPIGHSLRVGTREILEALLADGDDAKCGECLREIIKIRAVQELSASDALRFIFDLKDVVRETVEEAGGDAGLASELARFERRIDEFALTAFDAYVECRERVSELRVDAAKRRVSWVTEKLNERGFDPELSRMNLDGECPKE